MYNVVFSFIEEGSKGLLCSELKKHRPGAVTISGSYSTLSIIVSRVPADAIGGVVSLGLNVADEIRIDKLS